MDTGYDVGGGYKYQPSEGTVDFIKSKSGSGADVTSKPRKTQPELVSGCHQ